MIENFDTIDMTKRTPSNIDNSFHIYKARAYSNCGEGDDRIQVRILPYMMSLPEAEEKNLPIYTPFFRGQTLKVPTEKESPNGIGALLWVAAIPDFTFGYILGEANNNTGSGDSDKLLDSWPFTKVKNFLLSNNCISENFNYKDIMVDLRNPTGTYIEFHSISKGTKWILTSQGDIFSIQPGKILLQSSEGTNSDAAKSRVTITPDTVEVNSNSFIVNAKKVVLGKHGHHLVGTLAPGSVSQNGMNFKSIENIYV